MSGRLSFTCGRQARQLSKTPISLKTLALAVNELYEDFSSIEALADFRRSGGNPMTFPRWFGGTHFALLRNLSGT
jgi:hypothetical protein